MSDSVHLLIPFAGHRSSGAQDGQATLKLPHLEMLLARMDCVRADEGDGTQLSVPHERALAREYGIEAADGQVPWAAWHRAQSGRGAQGEACAWITPCHWRMGTGQVTMDDPQKLQLSEQDSRTLLAAMHPYFEQDGLRLEYETPTQWVATGELFRALPTASLDRVAGRTVDGWMPRGDEARPLRRLQQEMQMLLYTHALNDERAAAGLLPVNSFWVSATGALSSHAPHAAPEGLTVAHNLREAALQQDEAAWRAAWEELDAKACAHLAGLLGEKRSLTLTLCGERSSRTLAPAAGWWRRLTRPFQRPRAAEFLETL